MSRSLGKYFLEELKNGYLNPLLEFVKQDDTLFFAIRDNCVNLYYRGGNLLKVKMKPDGGYEATFDTNYFLHGNVTLPESIFFDKATVEKWVNLFPRLKHEMDVYFATYKKPEREFQQLVARENSRSTISNSTDYFIVDIEYAEPKINARFDMIAIKWLSKGAIRKNGDSCRLALIEMKYGDAALTGNAGLKKHIKDIEKMDLKKMDIIKNEAVNIFEQLCELKLIQFSEGGNSNQIKTLTNMLPEFIFLLANHDPESTILKEEVKQINPLSNAELKFATASFMGYGLFENDIISLNDFKRHL
ncbi:hypothetical protein EZS27_004901 [termite gut metagenome]|uniref:Uncharacterized protein n=1 Tax=termite gut metagenome TaxID=433724 RepID=A0A5J4SPA2_9ZZZZ